MTYSVTKIFEKGFENHTKFQKNEIAYSESDYNVIIKTIKNIFGYEIIEKKYFCEPICYGNDELRIYDKYGERVTTYYGNNWGKYELDGILTFDNSLKRFVIFQFREYFVKSDSDFHIIDGINHFNFYYKNLGINYKNEFLKNCEKDEVNTDLTKLIVIYRDVHYSQLLEYLNPYDNYSKIIELWKYTNFDKKYFIEKFPKSYQEVKWTNSYLSESEFLNLFCVDEVISNKYEILKEYLLYKFLDVEINSGIDGKKVDEFIEKTYGEYDYHNEDDYFSYVGAQGHSEKAESDLLYLDKFIQSFIDNYYELFPYKQNEITFNKTDYLYLYFKLKTIGIKYTEELGYQFDETMNEYLLLNFTFYKQEIRVSFNFMDEKLKNNLNELVINHSTKSSEIKDFVYSYFENINYE